MANVKNFGLVGVSNSVQFGKNGPQVDTTTLDTFEFYKKGGSLGANYSLVNTGALNVKTGDLTATQGNFYLSNVNAAIVVGGDTVLSRAEVGTINGAVGAYRFGGVAGLAIPVGTTTDKATLTGVDGLVRLNSDMGIIEYFYGGDWTSLATGGVALTGVTVATANGLAGTSSSGTTPELTLTTTVTGLLTGDSSTGVISAVVSGIDIKTVGGVNLLGGGDVGVIGASYGGTGINNGSKTITLGGNVSTAGTLTTAGDFTTAGAYALTFTTTGTTALTLPQSGELATVGNTVSSFSGGTTGLTPNVASTGDIVLNGTLVVANGGTGLATVTANGVVFGNGTTPVGVTAAGTTGNVLIVGAEGVPTFGTIDLAASAAVGTSILGLANGGTNAALVGSIGSIAYNNGTAIVNSIVGTGGQVLTSGGTAAPTWTSVSTNADAGTLVLRDSVDGTFTVVGATFTGSATTSGVTLNGTVTNATDATTKAYVDNLLSGLSWKNAAQVLASDNQGLAGSGALVIDGVNLVAGDRVLLTAQTVTADNGIYEVTFASTAWTLVRTADDATPGQLNGAAIFIEQGAAKDTAWTQTEQLSTTFDGQVWAQFSGAGAYSGGDAVTVSGTTISTLFDGVTVSLNGHNELTVPGSATAYQSLVSNGTGTSASWQAVALDQAAAVSGVLPIQNGGTNLSATVDGQVFFGKTGGGFAQSAAMTFNPTTNTLAIGSTASTLIIDGTTATISTSVGSGVNLNLVPDTGLTMFGTGLTIDGLGSIISTSASNLVLAAGTGTVALQAGAGSSTVTLLAQSPTNLVADLVLSAVNGITLATSAGNAIIDFTGNDGTPIANIVGITAATYAANIATVDTALVNKFYVDQAIANGAEKGAVKAIKFTAVSGVNTTSTILMPAFSTVLSVKVQVTTHGAGQTVSVGSATSPELYMSAAESDEATVGIYLAETFVTTGATAEAIVVSFNPTGLDQVAPTVNVIVEYQIAQ